MACRQGDCTGRISVSAQAARADTLKMLYRYLYIDSVIEHAAQRAAIGAPAGVWKSSENIIGLVAGGPPQSPID